MTKITKIHKHDSKNILLQMEEMYEDAFENAIPFDMLRSLEGDYREVSIEAIIDGDDVYGFAYTITHDWMSYVMCLVIREDVRDKGYGTMLLSHIKDEAYRAGIRIVAADIEGYDSTEKDSINRRRASFYTMNGMTDIGKSVFDDGKQCVGDRLMCITDGIRSYDEICDELRAMVNETLNGDGFHEIGTPLHDEGSLGFILMFDENDLPDDDEGDNDASNDDDMNVNV